LKPFFPPKSYDRLLAYARQRYLDEYKKTGRSEVVPPELKDHRCDLCEMCKELGHACNGKKPKDETSRSDTVEAE
jgi:hypothetical protein